MSGLTPHCDKDRFIALLKGLKAAYSSPNFLPDDKAVKVWYQMLMDLPLDVLSLAIQRHIAMSQYPPTIAELRSGCADILTADIDDWTGAWGKVVEAVSRYGLANGREAMSHLDPVTVEAVRRVGYWDICNSENISIERASFRTAYEQIVARERQRAVVPEPLRMKIEDTREKNSKNSKFLVDKSRNEEYD